MSNPTVRLEVLDLVDEAVANGATRERACEVVGIPSSTLRRWRPRGCDKPLVDKRPEADRPLPANRYTEEERDEMVNICNEQRFASFPPSQIIPALADEERYVGSESTFYRVLKERDQQNHRGRAKRRTKPKASTTHTAMRSNQVWMMDVTWLPTRVKGRFFYLYMIEDLYDRSGVNWEVFEEENGEHTKAVVQQALWRAKCVQSPPVLHSDNGSPFKAHTVQQKLVSMGIVPSHSRARVSNDNAFIESMFRTLKYCPMWPSKGFETLDEAREWVQRYMQWYNHEHRHSALKFVTPAQRRRGEDKEILAKRDAVYKEARAARPDRWSGETRDWSPIGAVTLNPDKSEEDKDKCDTTSSKKS